MWIDDYVVNLSVVLLLVGGLTLIYLLLYVVLRAALWLEEKLAGRGLIDRILTR